MHPTLLILVLVAVAAATTCENLNANYEIFASGANDVIAVRQSDGSIRATPFQFQVGKFDNWRTVLRSRQGRQVSILVNDIEAPVKLTITDTGEACFTRQRNRHSLSSDELETLNLQPGMNLGIYRVPSLKVEVRFIVYLMTQNDKLVVTDVDGTITESDVRGRVFPAFGFKVNHEGVVRLFDGVVRNGYTMIYLTARSMAEDGDTREYLFETLDDTDGGYSLPFGPVLMSPKSVTEAITEAMIGPDRQKTKTLKEILKLFDLGAEVVEAAFGNKETDQVAYVNAGIPTDRIFIVDEQSVMRNSGDGSISSYIELANSVNTLFPKLT